MTSSPVTRSISLPILLPSFETDSDQYETSLLINQSETLIGEAFLNSAGYHNVHKIADSLQGFIFSAELMSKPVIIKEVEKPLYIHQLAINHETGEMFRVDENIAKEAEIMKIINKESENNNKIMQAMVKIIDFYQTEYALYLVMENGGSSFYDFIIAVHIKINEKRLRIKKWQSYAKCLLWQLCTYIQWLHSIDCCHLDISMENLLINGAKWMEDINDPGYYILNMNEISIKLCDFGLAEIFNKNDFACNKYCGKLQYLSPEIASRQVSYQANKADIYSLGIVFFAMCFGHMPYKCPDSKIDKCYQYIADGKLYKLLKTWKRLVYTSLPMLHLMRKMMEFDENKRYDIVQVANHHWFNDISTVQIS